MEKFNNNADNPVSAAKEAWFVDGIRIGEATTTEGASSMLMRISTDDHPLANYIESTVRNENVDNRQTKVVFEIDITRNPGFYYYNVILPVGLLTMLSFLVFLLPPDTVGDRLAVSVTLYLALIAFQFVLTEYIPPTAYQTKMHSFILWANLIMTATAFESLFVYYVYTVMKEGSGSGSGGGSGSGSGSGFGGEEEENAHSKIGSALEKMLEKAIHGAGGGGIGQGRSKIHLPVVAESDDIIVEEIGEEQNEEEEKNIVKKRKMNSYYYNDENGPGGENKNQNQNQNQNKIEKKNDNKKREANTTKQEKKAAAKFKRGASMSRLKDLKTKQMKEKVHAVDQVCLVVFPIFFTFIYKWTFGE